MKSEVEGAIQEIFNSDFERTIDRAERILDESIIKLNSLLKIQKSHEELTKKISEGKKNAFQKNINVSIIEFDDLQSKLESLKTETPIEFSRKIEDFNEQLNEIEKKSELIYQCLEETEKKLKKLPKKEPVTEEITEEIQKLTQSSKISKEEIEEAKKEIDYKLKKYQEDTQKINSILGEISSRVEYIKKEVKKTSNKNPPTQEFDDINQEFIKINKIKTHLQKTIDKELNDILNKNWSIREINLLNEKFVKIKKIESRIQKTLEREVKTKKEQELKRQALREAAALKKTYAHTPIRKKSGESKLDLIKKVEQAKKLQNPIEEHYYNEYQEFEQTRNTVENDCYKNVVTSLKSPSVKFLRYSCPNCANQMKKSESLSGWCCPECGSYVEGFYNYEPEPECPNCDWIIDKSGECTYCGSHLGTDIFGLD